MKIGILSYHFANNYGAMMQTYSLQSVLSEMGAEVQFLDFRSKLQSSNNSLFFRCILIGECDKKHRTIAPL